MKHLREYSQRKITFSAQRPAASRVGACTPDCRKLSPQSPWLDLSKKIPHQLAQQLICTWSPDTTNKLTNEKKTVVHSKDKMKIGEKENWRKCITSLCLHSLIPTIQSDEY